MKTNEIRGQKILLLGYGKEGQSTHQWLLKNYPDIKVSLADQKEVNPALSAAKVYTGTDYLSHLGDFDTVIRSPGIPAHLHKLKDFQKSGGWVTSATNLFFSVCPGKTIGITGTKGKSTTSALIAQILGTKYADIRLVGNIGNPMLDALDGASDQSIFVIELSSHQLEDCRFSPHVAVILNIVPEHLDYYRDFRAYQWAKSHIVAFQNSADSVIFNPDSKTAAEIAETSKAGKFRFSHEARQESAAWIDKNKIYSNVTGKTSLVMDTHKVLLKGNLVNILAAVVVGSLLKVPSGRIGEAISSFKPLTHRLELVGKFKGIIFYNDSLATIPEATMHALDSLGESVETLLVGGFDRGLDYTKLGIYLADRRGLRNVILFPDTGTRIWQEIIKASPQITGLKNFKVKSMEEAVRIAFAVTSPGKICLLSPASASYNLFRDYAERGDKFKELINANYEMLASKIKI